MAFCIYWIHLITITFIMGADADGQFAVLHAPRSVLFVSGSGPQNDALSDIYLVALGFTSGLENGSWSQLKIVNPFDTPEAAVVLYVDGVSSLGAFEDHTKTYRLNMATNETETFDVLEKRISKLEIPKFTLVNMKLSSEYDLRKYSPIFGEYTNYKLPKLPLVYLKYTVEQDYRFLREWQALKAITLSVRSGVLKPDGVQDFYMLRFGSLQELIKHYGEYSNPATEAKKLLNHQIRQLNKAFMTAYDGSVLFSVVVTKVITDIAIQRERRDAGFLNKQINKLKRSEPEEVTSTSSTTTTTTTTTEKPGGLGAIQDVIPEPSNEEGNEGEKDKKKEDKNKDEKESDDKNNDGKNEKVDKDKNEEGEKEEKDDITPLKPTLKGQPTHDIAMTHIIFWTCIALFYALIAVCYTMISLDPGRDSVVYRMTSQIDRIKME